eukprot:scaffold7001_cov36-Tisochrysis_lutea.AAC.2
MANTSSAWSYKEGNPQLIGIQYNPTHRSMHKHVAMQTHHKHPNAIYCTHLECIGTCPHLPSLLAS